MSKAVKGIKPRTLIAKSRQRNQGGYDFYRKQWVEKHKPQIVSHTGAWWGGAI